MTGAVVGTAKFGTGKFGKDVGGEIEVGDGTIAHIFCAKYHADGKLVWVKAGEAQAGGAGYGVAVDARAK